MITSLGANPWRTPSFEMAPWRDTHNSAPTSENHIHGSSVSPRLAPRSSSTNQQAPQILSSVSNAVAPSSGRQTVSIGSRLHLAHGLGVMRIKGSSEAALSPKGSAPKAKSEFLVGEDDGLYWLNFGGDPTSA